MVSLRDALVRVGFPDVQMSNVLTAGVEVSPTARACYEAELFNAAKIFYKRHLRNLRATQVSYPSRFKIRAAREREDYLQRRRQDERLLAKRTPQPSARSYIHREPGPKATWEQILGA